MKRLILTALIVSGLTGAIAQNVNAQQDTTVTKERKMKKFDMDLGVGISIGKKDSTGKTNMSKGRFIGRITIAKIIIIV